MAPAPVRFVIEAALVVCVGIALALAEVDLLVFAAIVAAILIVLAALERTVLQGRAPRRSAREPVESGLPLHEPGVEREGVATATDAAAQAPVDDVPAAPGEPFRPTWRPPFGARPGEQAEEPPAEEELPAEQDLPEPAVEVRAEVSQPVTVEPAQPAAELTLDERDRSERPRVQLVAPPPELEPAPVQAPPSTVVVELPARGAREWNLWDLERRARERSGEDPLRDEEWAALFVYLREYATPDGMLPPEFDPLVRESFAALLVTAPH